MQAILSFIFAFFEQNAYMFVWKPKFVEFSNLQVDMQTRFVKRVSRSGSSDNGFLYMEKSQGADSIRQIGCIRTVLKAECILSMKLQLAIVRGYDEQKARSVGCICYQDNKKSPLLFSQDSLWLEVARMVADIAEGGTTLALSIISTAY